MTREEAINIVRNIYQTDAEKEALQALIPELDFDFADREKFRREAAKDFTVALVSSGSGLNPKTIAYAIEMADELIKQLREK